MRRWESTISRSFIAFHKAETSLLRRERTEWIAIRLSEWSSSLGNPRFPIDIPIVPLFSTRDQRNLCTFYSRVIAFASLWKLETLNFETANLDRLDYIILIFLIQRIDCTFLSKDRFKKKSIWKKNISIKYFCKINVFFLRHLPYRLSFIFLLYFHIKIRVLYIFINNPFVVNFQNIVQIRSDERIEGKREKRFDISLVVNGGNIS